VFVSFCHYLFVSLFCFLFVSSFRYFLFDFCFFFTFLFASSFFIAYLFLPFIPSFFLSLFLFLCHLFMRSNVEVSITQLGDMVDFTFRLLCLPVRLHILLCALYSNSGLHAEENFRNTCQ
jgi:hypothetical protein